jgi:hypothetical protein
MAVRFWRSARSKTARLVLRTLLEVSQVLLDRQGPRMPVPKHPFLPHHATHQNPSLEFSFEKRFMLQKTTQGSYCGLCWRSARPCLMRRVRECLFPNTRSCHPHVSTASAVILLEHFRHLVGRCDPHPWPPARAILEAVHALGVVPATRSTSR